MPRIDEDVLDCAIYLYPSREAALGGERAGGSGFLIGLPSQRYPRYHSYYAVTNSHVIATGSTVVRINTQQGTTDILETPQAAWFHHPDGDDIAVCCVTRELSNERLRFKLVRATDLLLSKEQMEANYSGPGDDVFLVGRFITHEGKQRNLPTIRFGSISMMPEEPVYQLERGINQESFLIEIRSLQGYSGSPVFLVETSLRGSYPITKPWLLGIVWGHMHTYELVLQSDFRTPVEENLSDRLYVKSPTGMAGVVPSWKLQELLDSEQLAAQRDADGEEYYRTAEANGTQLDDESDENGAN